MSPKERHFEFMKIALGCFKNYGIASEANTPYMIKESIRVADDALTEFEKRWPEEEKKLMRSFLSCCGQDKCKNGLKKGCKGYHCKCMNLDGECQNMHYADCFDHYRHELKEYIPKS